MSRTARPTLMFPFALSNVAMTPSMTWLMLRTPSSSFRSAASLASPASNCAFRFAGVCGCSGVWAPSCDFGPLSAEGEANRSSLPDSSIGPTVEISGPASKIGQAAWDVTKWFTEALPMLFRGGMEMTWVVYFLCAGYGVTAMLDHSMHGNDELWFVWSRLIAERRVWGQMDLWGLTSFHASRLAKCMQLNSKMAETRTDRGRGRRGGVTGVLARPLSSLPWGLGALAQAALTAQPPFLRPLHPNSNFHTTQLSRLLHHHRRRRVFFFGS